MNSNPSDKFFKRLLSKEPFDFKARLISCKIISPLSSNYGCHCRANHITIEYNDDDGNILEYRIAFL